MKFLDLKIAYWFGTAPWLAGICRYIYDTDGS